MGRPLGSKNKPRSESKDSHHLNKRIVPILLPNSKEERKPRSPEEELNDFDRFTYLPNVRAVRPAPTLLPSDVTPRPRRYTILDRIERPNELPEYILREEDASIPQRESRDSTQNQRTPLLSADLNPTTRTNGSFRSHSTTPHSSSEPVSDYDSDDAFLLRIPLLYIDRYVSARQVEDYENKRFANPKPEDDLLHGRHHDNSSQSSGSTSRRQNVQQAEAREVKRIGRPPKKRRLLEAVVINNAVSKSPMSKSLASDSDLSDSGQQTGHTYDNEGDVDMINSIEQADDLSTAEDEAEVTLQAFLPNRTTNATPTVLQRSTRSISTVDSRSSMAPPPVPKSPATSRQVSGSLQSSSPSRNTRSRATSYASAHSHRPASRSQSIVSTDPMVLVPGPSPPKAGVPRIQKPLEGKAQFLRPETATADDAKELIKSQWKPALYKSTITPPKPQSARSEINNQTNQKTKPRLEPASPKRVSMRTPATQPAYTPTSSKKQAQKHKFIQSKLSFAKATPKQQLSAKKQSPSPLKKVPNTPPPADEEEDENKGVNEEEEEFEVSKILTHADNETGRYFQVAWVGYSEEDSTWVTEEELAGAKKLLRKYKKRNGLA